TTSKRDWSSDVCSSDLLVPDTLTGPIVPARVDAFPVRDGPRRIPVGSGHSPLKEPVLIAQVADSESEVPRHTLRRIPHRLPVPQIGRASCRGREEHTKA